jgi:hypothetical protein
LDINIAKSRKIERKCVDLIVLGIPWKSTEEVVRHYFEQYGEVVLCEVKRIYVISLITLTMNNARYAFLSYFFVVNACSYYKYISEKCAEIIS